MGPVKVPDAIGGDPAAKDAPAHRYGAPATSDGAVTAVQGRAAWDVTFPGIRPRARIRIRLMRTIRIPENGRTWQLPPALGTFPANTQATTVSRALSRGSRRRINDMHGIRLLRGRADLQEANRTLVVGDKDTDMEAAARAGGIGCAAGWGIAEHERERMRRISHSYLTSPLELLPLLAWMDSFTKGKSIVPPEY